MARSLETAHIYAREIAGDLQLKSRARNILSYETLVTPVPYDHRALYNGALPKNFEDIPEGPEKAKLSQRANDIAVDHLLTLKTPEAQVFKNEIAGSLATFIEHYAEMTKRLKSGSRVLIPAGTHSGLIEPFLQKVLIRTKKDGMKTRGFNNLQELGGSIHPSESFSVSINTDEEGNIKDLTVTFENTQRFPEEVLTLDRDMIQSLAEYYTALHHTRVGK